MRSKATATSKPKSKPKSKAGGKPPQGRAEARPAMGDEARARAAKERGESSAKAGAKAKSGPLDGKQRRYLRSLGHHLEPVVQLGKQGLSQSVTDAVQEAIVRHELVKIRIGTECPDDRATVATSLAAAVKAELVQELGRTVLLYRRHPKEPKIDLPRS